MSIYTVYVRVCVCVYNVCRKLSKGFRYIDDVLFLNSGTQFETEKSNIYPGELVINRENESNNKASFLDIEIEIIDKKFNTRFTINVRISVFK